MVWGLYSEEPSPEGGWLFVVGIQEKGLWKTEKTNLWLPKGEVGEG